MSSLASHPFLRPTFWSYDLCDLDSEIHKPLIIKQILNAGDKQALDWLKQSYPDTEIKAVIYDSMVSEWSKKSLSLWSKIYEVNPKRVGRFT